MILASITTRKGTGDDWSGSSSSEVRDAEGLPARSPTGPTTRPGIAESAVTPSRVSQPPVSRPPPCSSGTSLRRQSTTAPQGSLDEPARRQRRPTPDAPSATLVPDDEPTQPAYGPDTLPIDPCELLEPSSREADMRPRDRCLLTLLSGEHVGAFFRLNPEGLVVGRGEDAGARIDDPYLSRHHARFFLSGGVPCVQDLGSKNGTYIGGGRITDTQPLRDGQHVRLGRDVVLRCGLYDAIEEKAILELYETSFEDLLTGAHNRRYFEAQLESERGYAGRHSAPLSVVLFDVDHFKRINDAFGHHAGDGVLRVVAAAVHRVLRPEDVLARYGGDEFAVLLRDTPIRQAEILGERIRRTIERLPFRPRGRELRVTVSVGVASWQPGPDDDGRSLVGLADEAMYGAKTAGRNRVIALRRR